MDPYLALNRSRTNPAVLGVEEVSVGVGLTASPRGVGTLRVLEGALKGRNVGSRRGAERIMSSTRSAAPDCTRMVGLYVWLLAGKRWDGGGSPSKSPKRDDA